MPSTNNTRTSMSMNITLFMASPGPLVGGMEKQVAMQANLLQCYPDISITVIASSDYESLFDQDIRFIPLKLARSRRNPILLWQLTQAIRSTNPHIVHAHGHKAAEICARVRRGFKGVKWLATAHGLKKKNHALTKFDNVLCVSQGIQQQLGEIPSTVVFNGVEPLQEGAITKAELCAIYDLKPEFPLLIALGRLARVKRYDALVTAMEGLDANLLVVGGGDELAALQKVAPKNVIFAGYQKEGRNWLAAADMMVITSEREGFSLAMIEGLMSETVVVSTRVPGATELLPDACLIDSIEVSDLRKSLTDKIRCLAQLRAQLESSFQFAKTELTTESSAKAHYQVYQNVLS